MFIHRVLQAMKLHKVKYAIAGGWAVALHGAVRGTIDLDLLVVLTLNNLERAQMALNSTGLQSRLPLVAKDVFEFREEYIRNQKMLAWRFVNPLNQAEVVDLLIIEDLQDMATTTVRIGKDQIPIVALEDLIQMKKRSGRPQDLEDIKALETIRK